MSELTPYLCVADSWQAIDWYAAALGAEVVLEPIVMDDGRVGRGVAAPDPARGASVSMHLTVDDCDAVAARVVEHGVTLDRGPEDSPPAGRVAVFRDPFGHRWFLNQPLA